MLKGKIITSGSLAGELRVWHRGQWIVQRCPFSGINKPCSDECPLFDDTEKVFHESDAWGESIAVPGLCLGCSNSDGQIELVPECEEENPERTPGQ